MQDQQIGWRKFPSVLNDQQMIAVSKPAPPKPKIWHAKGRAVNLRPPPQREPWKRLRRCSLWPILLGIPAHARGAAVCMKIRPEGHVLLAF
ncbi:hypothetical protein [Hyphomonas sp. CACIAM 19H1]|uniref:hypothetical protein n=1 Tax=Hyphomonas sp. CACIAM 19H1 TaxID=1873716 RepID=UPI0013B04DAA|nr:hypothetical protein [Hyphomonas sp. CACIAM 19H1]